MGELGASGRESEPTDSSKYPRKLSFWDFLWDRGTDLLSFQTKRTLGLRGFGFYLQCCWAFSSGGMWRRVAESCSPTFASHLKTQSGNTDPTARLRIPYDLNAQPFELWNMQGNILTSRVNVGFSKRILIYVVTWQWVGEISINMRASGPSVKRTEDIQIKYRHKC
jgi:hypothetical protein